MQFECHVPGQGSSASAQLNCSDLAVFGHVLLNEVPHFLVAKLEWLQVILGITSFVLSSGQWAYVLDQLRIDSVTSEIRGPVNDVKESVLFKAIVILLLAELGSVLNFLKAI